MLKRTESLIPVSMLIMILILTSDTNMMMSQRQTNVQHCKGFHRHERTFYENLGEKRRETKKRHSPCTRFTSEQEEKGKKLCERHEATGQPLLLEAWLAQREGSKMPARELHRYTLFCSTTLLSQFTNCCSCQILNACFTAQDKHCWCSKKFHIGALFQSEMSYISTENQSWGI